MVTRVGFSGGQTSVRVNIEHSLRPESTLPLATTSAGPANGPVSISASRNHFSSESAKTIIDVLQTVLKSREKRPLEQAQIVNSRTFDVFFAMSISLPAAIPAAAAPFHLSVRLVLSGSMVQGARVVDGASPPSRPRLFLA